MNHQSIVGALRRAGLVAATLCAACGGGVDAHAPGGRIGSAIVGGDITSIAEHPWQVSLQAWDGWEFCGGSIISTGWVLTAQHCVEYDSADAIRVVAGATRLSEADEGEIVGVSEIIKFPGYQAPETGGDVALLRLEQPLVPRQTVASIALVTAPDAAAGATDPGVVATTSGWGVLADGGWQTPDALHAVDVPIVSNASTEQLYNEDITADQIAAGADGLDSCQGDSGGPLTVPSSRGPLLAGVVSWGFACGELPGLYARVSSFVAWIEDETGIDASPSATNPPADDPPSDAPPADAPPSDDVSDDPPSDEPPTDDGSDVPDGPPGTTPPTDDALSAPDEVDPAGSSDDDEACPADATPEGQGCSSSGQGSTAALAALAVCLRTRRRR